MRAGTRAGGEQFGMIAPHTVANVRCSYAVAIGSPHVTIADDCGSGSYLASAD